MHSFWLCFIPLFVAVDAIGILPLYLTLTEGIQETRRKRVLLHSVITALVVGTTFLIVGNTIISVLGIAISDFMIAGGILLLMFSITDLVTYEKRSRSIEGDEIGAVPIGVPLIVGPAVLATGLLQVHEFGYPLTLLALFINICLAGILFWLSPLITRLIGKTGAKVVSKLASLLMAAYAIMMIRRGVEIFLKAYVS